jgi:hypothetical protein
VSRRRDLLLHCFYCGALVRADAVGDHMPIPKEAGGAQTVPCCESCHDMKDRFSLDDWPVEWVSAVVADMPLMSRESRLLLARVLRLGAVLAQRNAGHRAQIKSAAFDLQGSESCQ